MIKRINEFTGLNLSYSGQNAQPLFWFDIIEHILKDESGNEFVLAIAIHPFDRYYLKKLSENFERVGNNPFIYTQDVDYTTVGVIDLNKLSLFNYEKYRSEIKNESILGLFLPSLVDKLSSLFSYRNLQKNKGESVAFSFRPLCFVPNTHFNKKCFIKFLKDVVDFRNNFNDENISCSSLDNEEIIGFSLNKFLSIYPNNENYLISISDNVFDVNIPFSIENSTGILGSWNVPIPRLFFLKVINYIFNTFSNIEKVEYKNIIFDPYIDDHRWRHNDFYIPLPQNIEDLKIRLSHKSRHNLRRERRLIEEAFSNLILEDLKILDSIPKNIVDKFYEFKYSTHEDLNEEYDITACNITNVYLLKTGVDDIRGIALSCEQGDIVFMENHTFDSKYREYSFGQVLYDMYLEALINKKKTGLSLAGGNLEYKKRYGSICYIAYSGSIKQKDVARIKTLQTHKWNKKNIFVRLKFRLTRSKQ